MSRTPGWLEPDGGCPPVGVVFGVTLAFAVLRRRGRRPAAVGLGFGGLVVLDLAAFFVVGEPFSLHTATFVVVLVYSSFRWGTGRQAATGLAIVLLEWLVAVTTDFPGVTDAGGGLVVLLFPAALGVLVRYRRIVGTRRLERVRFREREVPARELHGTVAHHVSANAFQAQVGRFLRRGDGAPEVLTRRVVADTGGLATAEGNRGPRVDVERCGDLDEPRPSVEVALYRVAQEPITNAKRHAARVRVPVDGGTVRLSVSDDGERGPSDSRVPGCGLVGMAERVTLPGGTLEAGRGTDRGWTVRAVIPRREVLT